MSRIIVIGASLAGLRACETLRTEGFDGDITVIGAEQRAFYDRPPLSKRYLAGEWTTDRIGLRKPEAIDGLGLDLRTGTRATSLSAATRTVTVVSEPITAHGQVTAEGQVTADGEITADGVIIATGSSARRLPLDVPRSGVHVLRTVDDADSLRPRLGPGSRIVVIGAGFIGLEVAATARAAGAEVTVLEGQPAPLSRSLGPEVGRAIADVHRRHGVDVRCNVVVEQVIGTDAVTGVRVDGEVIPAATVVVGIGAAPETGWLEGSGLETRDGVVCDQTLRAAPMVYAAGDVVRWPHPLYADVEADIRVEHWTNAAEQGAVAARNLLAEMAGSSGETYRAVPFFWSDQFEARLQFLGRSVPGATAEIVAGSADSGTFCAAYFAGGLLRGVLGVSMPRLVMPARALLEKQTSPDEARAHFAVSGG